MLVTYFPVHLYFYENKIINVLITLLCLYFRTYLLFNNNIPGGEKSEAPWTEGWRCYCSGDWRGWRSGAGWNLSASEWSQVETKLRIFFLFYGL